MDRVPAWTARLAARARLLRRAFPPSSRALPEGPLCRGGVLSPDLVLAAYSLGLFPWSGEGEPSLRCTPSPRCVLFPENHRLPRRAARAQRALPFQISLDRAFPRVLAGCADRSETWITRDVARCFGALFRLGFVHSVEAWREGELCGGLYGLALGRAFFGESMFHTVPEASRACLAALAALLRLRGAELLDCQQATPHVLAQGAVLLEREDFEERLALALQFREGAGDALSEEYAQSPGAAPLWPFLPWRTRYVWRLGSWVPGEGAQGQGD